MTHLPYGMYFNNNKCEFFSDKSAWNDYPHKDYMTYPDNTLKSIMYQHYDTEVCALKYLSDYIALLKKEGIYDNTQIFVVSDHAGQDSINMPINNNVDTLLFKDFGAKGTLKIDNRLMANYDISSIFCENLKGGCPNVPKNILKNYHTNREIIHALTLFKDKYGYLVTKAYKVRGNIYDEKNWVDISDSKYGIVNMTK